MKSRYYDPAICRFINADGLASTGQGFVGCNMFAYCNNNPVMFADCDGVSPIALWYYLFLNSEYGYIHRRVQERILATGMGSLGMEISVSRSNGTKGRADIVNKTTGEVWEIKYANKTNPTSALVLAEKQALSYVGAACNIPARKITSLGSAGMFSGTFMVNCLGVTYLVSYVTPSDGVIVYTVDALEQYDYQSDFVYTPTPDRKPSVEQKKKLAYAACLAALAAIGGVFYGAGTAFRDKQMVMLEG